MFRHRGRQRKLNRLCGTLPYVAPELMSRMEFSAQPADIWSCGIVLTAMLAGGEVFLHVFTCSKVVHLDLGDAVLPCCCRVAVGPAYWNLPGVFWLAAEENFYYALEEDRCPASQLNLAPQIVCLFNFTVTFPSIWSLLTKTHTAFLLSCDPGLLTKILLHDPEKRITIPDIKKDRWFNKGFKTGISPFLMHECL